MPLTGAWPSCDRIGKPLPVERAVLARALGPGVCPHRGVLTSSWPLPLDLPKERKPIERSGTLQKLAQHDSSKKLTSAIKSGGKENFQHF